MDRFVMKVALQIIREGIGILVSLGGFLCECFEHYGIQIAVQLPCQSFRRGIACRACVRIALGAGLFNVDCGKGVIEHAD